MKSATPPYLWLWIFLLPVVLAQEPQCCHRVRSHPACQESCDQMALEASAAGRRQHLSNLRNNCPMTLTTFWQCVNISASDIWQEDTGWPGRLCCINARAGQCHAACMQASSFTQASSACARHEEPSLFQCLDRFEKKERCCHHASTATQCRHKCEAVFDALTPTDEMSLDVSIYCRDVSQTVVRCVENYTSVAIPARDPRDSLHCCERSHSASCRETCRRVHTNLTSESDIIDSLLAECGGTIQPHVGMWECFLLNSGSHGTSDWPYPVPNLSALDGAKLQCCSRAVSVRCREICVKLYSTSLSTKQSWNDFDEHCQYQPMEVSLLTCLADVQEPCQPGCSGLTYCTNFNGRPTDLFRSCSARSDGGAANDMQLWSEGLIRLPFMDIPVLDVAECESEMWKAIACTLQVKPCHPESHVNMICKADCIHILNQCIDQSRLAKGLTAQGLCNILSPLNEDAPCIPLSQYLDLTRPQQTKTNEITVPCRRDPCNNDTTGFSGICSINRGLCGYGEMCGQAKCTPGCRLGDASTFLVTRGSYVRLPDLPSNLACYKACKCSVNGMLEQCQRLQCETREACTENGERREHGSHYRVDCNECICYNGVETCSKRQCPVNLDFLPEASQQYTTMPCECTDQFVPVCGANGRTYPSACVARCAADLQDNEFEFGTCTSMRDPCASDPCKTNQRCVARQQVCLSVNYAVCPQYECIVSSHHCSREPRAPVCDTDGKEHHNLCTLHRRGKTLDYMGLCQTRCNLVNRRQVCGQNGETYTSECAAWSDRTIIDYYGACEAVGKPNGNLTAPQCSSVKCPHTTIPHCLGVTPPGACCPVCAAFTRVLFSKHEADNAASAFGNKAVSVGEVLKGLRTMVAVAECDLYGYLSIEGDIIISVMPTLGMPTEIQIEACNREAEKLGALINTRSPMVVSYMYLSPLLAASTTMVTTQPVATGAASLISSSHLLLRWCCAIAILLNKCSRWNR